MAHPSRDFVELNLSKEERDEAMLMASDDDTEVRFRKNGRERVSEPRESSFNPESRANAAPPLPVGAFKPPPPPPQRPDQDDQPSQAVTERRILQGLFDQYQPVGAQMSPTAGVANVQELTPSQREYLRAQLAATAAADKQAVYPNGARPEAERGRPAERVPKQPAQPTDRSRSRSVSSTRSLSFDTRECFLCHERGHLAKACPTSKFPRGQGQMVFTGQLEELVNARVADALMKAGVSSVQSDDDSRERRSDTAAPPDRFSSGVASGAPAARVLPVSSRLSRGGAAFQRPQLGTDGAPPASQWQWGDSWADAPVGPQANPIGPSVEQVSFRNPRREGMFSPPDRIPVRATPFEGKTEDIPELFSYIERHVIKGRDAKDALPEVWRFLRECLPDNVKRTSPAARAIESAKDLSYFKNCASAEDWERVKLFIRTRLANSGTLPEAQAALTAMRQGEATLTEHCDLFVTKVGVVLTLQQVMDRNQSTVELMTEAKFVTLFLMSLTSASLRSFAMGKRTPNITLLALVELVIQEWGSNRFLHQSLDADRKKELEAATVTAQAQVHAMYQQQRTGQNRGGQPRSNYVCFNCDQEGHISRDCPEKDTAASQPHSGGRAGLAPSRGSGNRGLVSRTTTRGRGDGRVTTGRVAGQSDPKATGKQWARPSSAKRKAMAEARGRGGNQRGRQGFNREIFALCARMQEGQEAATEMMGHLTAVLEDQAAVDEDEEPPDDVSESESAGRPTQAVDYNDDEDGDDQPE